MVFSKLVEILSEKEILDLVNIEPTGQYSRRIWFLMEWIAGTPIKGKDDLTKKSYIPVVDSKLQYAVSGIKSPRHLVLNNLPGSNKFCPLIFKSKKLERHIQKNYQNINKNKLSIKNSIIQNESEITGLNCENTMLGNKVKYTVKSKDLSIGDYNEILE